jgi:hypothetical protein
VCNEEARREVSGRLYLITAAAEDAAVPAAQGQSASLSASERKNASKLRGLGEIIEIVASAIELL